MTSIARRLTLHLLATVLALSAIAGACLYLYARAQLIAEFDSTLIARARAVAGIFQFDPRDGLEYNPTEQELADFRARHHPIYFEVWRDDGSVVARSASLKAGDISRLPGRSVAWAKLPDGRMGRVASQRSVPRVEQEGDRPIPRNVPTLTVSVAQEPVELNETLAVLGSSLLVGALILAGGVALAVTLTVRDGLRPLNRLGTEADAIGAGSLDHRFSQTDLPAELQPIAARLNGLLSRLDEAFARERRFTADVAHELRTPVAELRTLAEVALKWPADARPQQTCRDTLDIAQQMEALINRLLSIARCEAGAMHIAREPLDLCRVLREAWETCQPPSRAHHLHVDWSVPESLIVQCDRAMLMALVSNLLSNAVHHTPRDGTVQITAENAEGRAAFTIRNSCNALTPADLPHLFEPFWRKDAARSGGVRCGLGLAMVAAYAKALGLTLRAQLPASDVFQISVQFEHTDQIPTPAFKAPTNMPLSPA